MISKRSQKSSNSVESLRQGSFTAVKGVDITAPALNGDTVLDMVNLDVDVDGGVVLRKPVVHVSQAPTVLRKTDENTYVSYDTTTLHTVYLYDKKYVMYIQSTTSGDVYVTVSKSGTPAVVRLCWNTWLDGTEASLNLSDIATYSGHFQLPIDFTDASFTNTSFSTVCTNIKVNVTDACFKKAVDYAAAGVTDSGNSTDLYYKNLYTNASENSSSTWSARTLIVSESAFPNVDVDIKIVTPYTPELSPTDTLILDANLDADNPYAIRDVYNSTTPAVKGIVAYAPALVSESNTIYAPDFFKESGTTAKYHNGSLINPFTFTKIDIKDAGVRLSVQSDEHEFKILYDLSNCNVPKNIVKLYPKMSARLAVHVYRDDEYYAGPAGDVYYIIGTGTDTAFEDSAAANLGDPISLTEYVSKGIADTLTALHIVRLDTEYTRFDVSPMQNADFEVGDSYMPPNAFDRIFQKYITGNTSNISFSNISDSDPLKKYFLSIYSSDIVEGMYFLIELTGHVDGHPIGLLYCKVQCDYPVKDADGTYTFATKNLKVTEV